MDKKDFIYLLIGVLLGGIIILASNGAIPGLAVALYVIAAVSSIVAIIAFVEYFSPGSNKSSVIVNCPRCGESLTPSIYSLFGSYIVAQKIEPYLTKCPNCGYEVTDNK